MVPSTTIVALDSKLSGFMLHGEIVPNGSRTVTDEVVSGGKTLLFEQDTKEVVEGFLAKE
jgi:hypothetical protein